MKEKHLSALPKSKQKQLQTEFRKTNKKVQRIYGYYITSSVAMLAMFVVYIMTFAKVIAPHAGLMVLSVFVFINFVLASIVFAYTQISMFKKWLKKKYNIIYD